MTEWVRIAGWVLLHFVWQGSVLGFLAAGMLRGFRRASPGSRYAIGVCILSAMIAMPILTALAVASAPTGAAPSRWDGSAALLPGGPIGAVQTVQRALTVPFSTGLRIDASFPLLVSFWFACATILLLRALHGWWQIRRVHAAAMACDPSRWQAAADRLSRRLHLSTIVRVVEVRSLDVPAVVGWLRPVVLLPIAAIAGLPLPQVEAILAHELAHVRRHDYVVNLLQRLAESVLFYHPAVWWISARIGEEREHCCDDLAVQVCGDAQLYAAALAELESRRHLSAGFAVAATDGSLLKRIRRILHPSTPERIQPPHWTLTLALAALFTLVLGGPQRSPALLLAQATITVTDALTPPFHTRWSGPDGSGTITSVGTVVFTDDLRDVAAISDGGSLVLESSGLLSARRLEMHVVDGMLRRRYYVNGSEQPWSDEAARWLADALPFLVRRSGVSANERVQQVLQAGGVGGVLREIRLLYTDSVRGRYFRALFEHPGLLPQDADASLRAAADLISSSAELSQTLQAAIAAGLEDSDGFFYAARRIDSSADKGRVLASLLERADIMTARQVDFLGTAATIESNAECAAVLDAFRSKYSLASQPVRQAFLDALDTVSSTSERRRLLR
jgi:beta-lactamase regulating signal transducer with metallopeptidase domain